MKYSVLIRTLGTAGEKYRQTLQSVANQTIKPEKVYVALPHGYADPKETLGIETIIHTPKGMVAQRAFAFEQVEPVDWVLFLDDDVSFPNDFVERLSQVACREQADAVIPCIYRPNMGGVKRWFTNIYNELTMTRIRNWWDDKYFIKITSWGAFSVNARKRNDKTYLTQSGIGICGLCKLDALSAINFKEDVWLEKYGYALPDDQVMYYKMYLAGYKLVAAPGLTVKHLDGQTGHMSATDAIKKAKRNYKLSARNFSIFWYKYIWLKRHGLRKYWAACTFGLKVLVTVISTMLVCALKGRWSCCFASMEGYAEAFKEISHGEV